MANFRAFAQPWWVNLLLLVPLLAYLVFRRKHPRLQAIRFAPELRLVSRLEGNRDLSR